MEAQNVCFAVCIDHMQSWSLTRTLYHPTKTWDTAKISTTLHATDHTKSFHIVGQWKIGGREGLHGGRLGGNGPHRWWVVTEYVLVSLVLDGERTEMTLWLTGSYNTLTVKISIWYFATCTKNQSNILLSKIDLIFYNLYRNWLNILLLKVSSWKSTHQKYA